MIRTHIPRAKEATFCVCLPNPQMQDMPSPTGTGFFISPDGWFVTAAHVVTKNGQPNGEPRDDISKAWLQKETYYDESGQIVMGTMCPGNEGLDFIDPNVDFALLKVDFEKNNMREGFKDRDGFPYIQVSKRALCEGEPVFSFGYPLSTQTMIQQPGMTLGDTSFSPRVTSAMVSSLIDKTTMVMSPTMPKTYVLDKALNYGNSGGPILSSEDGKAYALCSRFQPFHIPQPHLKDKDGKPLKIMSPSLYGIVSRLSNASIMKELSDRGILVDD